MSDGAVEVLRELTASLSSGGVLQTQLTAVADAALILLPGDHASIRLLKRGQLLPCARRGVGVQHQPPEFRKGEGVLGWVVAQRRAVRIDDIEEDPRFAARPRGFAVRSLISVPLCSGPRVYGALSVSAPDPSAFTEADQNMASLLSNCAVPHLQLARLSRLVVTDENTHTFNRRYLFPRLASECRKAMLSGRPLSLLLLDLDHFKSVNDRYGHKVGDIVLARFADRVRKAVRSEDVFVRRGGEECVVIMPGADGAAAFRVAERVRQEVRERPIALPEDIQIPLTASIGVAVWDREESPGDFERRSDAAMYTAKSEGRDRVVMA